MQNLSLIQRFDNNENYFLKYRSILKTWGKKLLHPIKTNQHDVVNRAL